MDIIKNNPYRIIGILSNATAREIQSRKGKITAYAKVGKQITSEFDFPLFDSIVRDQNKIEKAFSAIQQSKEMLENSLFWFLNTNSFDETAINYLRNGDKEKAIQIWEKVTTEKEVTYKNYSCFNNIGTLKLLGESQEDIKEGIEKKIKLIESDSFKNFVHSVAGEAFIIDNQKQVENFINDIIKQFQGKYSNADTLKLFSNCNGTIQKYLSQKFTEEPVHNIESQIERTKKKRNENKINAFQFGLMLHENTKADLTLLNSLLGVNDLKYKVIADNLAKEIMQCGIDYFNESKENKSKEEYLENALTLNRIADSIAVGKLTKDRAKDHIATLEEMKDQELSEAIIVLQSIKDLYLENERNIRQQIKQLEKSDYEIIIGRKTINHRAVEESIKSSIEWQKVNEMIVDLLSDNNLKKIKECNKEEQKKEFLELMNWLKVNSLKSTPITAILNKYKNIPPKLPFKIISSDITNTGNKPLFTKFIRYIGLNLKIQVTEEKSVTLYFKYINPDGSVKRNSETSPVGYSRSEIQKLSINTKSINLSGWGNADKCTYEIGKHRIEVYVDEYMIHSKDFIVDLAPSEKLEIELKKAEERLVVIKNFQYFKSEFDTLNSQMSNIKQWQFLRSQSDREMQINEKQKQIDSLVKKADNEKESETSKQQSIINEIKSKIQKAEY
ncbi:hypothetical protein [Flavobacterium sp.]|uniref:hypothetical protein n=1 Tax=Flavobacterium sp. TaxID=239 RepID=UPI00260CEF3D|nr:hypothetical protein [Flavobacterium sp.]